MSFSLCIHKQATLLSFLIAYISSAYAQESNDSEWDIKVGVGAVSASTPWKGGITQVGPIPFLDASIGNWRFNGENPIGYQIQLNESWGFSVGLGPRNDGYDSNGLAFEKLSKDQIFNGYKKPDTEVVVNYGVTYGWLALDASRDVSSNSESNAASLSTELPIYQRDTGFRLAASMSIDWYDSDYVNYYFGVAGEQVNNSVGRVAYKTDAAINYEIGINAMYPLSKRWMLMGIISRTKLDDNLVDSPLIDSDYQDSAALLIIYQF